MCTALDVTEHILLSWATWGHEVILDSWHAPLRAPWLVISLWGLTWQWWGDELDNELSWRWALWTILDHNEADQCLNDSLSTWLSWISRNEHDGELLTVEFHSCWCWCWSLDVDHRWLDHETWCLLSIAAWRWTDLRLTVMPSDQILTFEMRWCDERLDEEWRFDRELRDWVLELHLMTRWILKDHRDHMRMMLAHERMNSLVESCCPVTDDAAEWWADISIWYWYWFIVKNMRWHELWWASWAAQQRAEGSEELKLIHEGWQPEMTRCMTLEAEWLDPIEILFLKVLKMTWKHDAWHDRVDCWQVWRWCWWSMTNTMSHCEVESVIDHILKWFINLPIENVTSWWLLDTRNLKNMMLIEELELRFVED